MRPPLRTTVLWVALSGLTSPAVGGGEPQPLVRAAIENVHMTGRLGQRHQSNGAYLVALHDRTIPAASFDMLNPFLNRAGPHEQPWDGEYAGKWLDAASLTCANTGDPALSTRLAPFAATLRSTQLRNGYMGIDLQPGGDWDLWNMWYVMHGLQCHFEHHGSQHSLECASGTGTYITSNYLPPGNALEIFSGAWGSGINVMDQLLRLHNHAASPPLVSLSNHIAANANAYNVMRQTHQVVLSHSYVVSAYLGGMTDYARRTRSATDLHWLDAVWQDVVDHHLFHTGSVGQGEVFWNPADYWPFFSHQETCATVEWLTWTNRLYETTGDVRYAQQIENTTYNALIGAQSSDGMKWMYYTKMDGAKPWFSGPTKCCYWSGPRGVARLPSLIYRTDEEGLRIDLYEASSAADLVINGTVVSVTQHTQYPEYGHVTIDVNPQMPVAFKLKLRLPDWAQDIALSVNNVPADVPLIAGAHAVIDRLWQPGDSVQLQMRLATTIVSRPSMVNMAGVAVRRGPEILSLDSRDNPGLDFSAVTLYANPLLIELNAIEGRRRYRCRVLMNGQPAQVAFTPFADAGNENAMFRTLLPISAQRTPLQQADVNADGQVNIDDLVAVITSWGACPLPPAPCPADVAPATGIVNIDDLVLVITQWG